MSVECANTGLVLCFYMLDSFGLLVEESNDHKLCKFIIRLYSLYPRIGVMFFHFSLSHFSISVCPVIDNFSWTFSVLCFLELIDHLFWCGFKLVNWNKNLSVGSKSTQRWKLEIPYPVLLFALLRYILELYLGRLLYRKTATLFCYYLCSQRSNTLLLVSFNS